MLAGLDRAFHEILDEGLLPGMEVVGVRMRDGDCFIPEVLLGAKYGRRLHFWDLAERRLEQTVEITDRAGTRTLTQSELLADPRLRTVSIAHDPVYRRPMIYKAIAMADRFTLTPLVAGSFAFWSGNLAMAHQNMGDRPVFSLGYGLCFGHNETKAIAMAVLDRFMAAFSAADEAGVKVVSGDDGLYGDSLGPAGSDGDEYVRTSAGSESVAATVMR